MTDPSRHLDPTRWFSFPEPLDLRSREQKTNSCDLGAFDHKLVWFFYCTYVDSGLADDVVGSESGVVGSGLADVGGSESGLADVVWSESGSANVVGSGLADVVDGCCGSVFPLLQEQS